MSAQAEPVVEALAEYWRPAVRLDLRRHATNRARGGCDIAVMFAAVMLRLRARYVSKAAILTSPGCSAPVENQSFA